MTGQLTIAHQVEATRVEGPHLRAALWVAGCSIRCPGCCNPELFERERGALASTHALTTWAQNAQSRHGIEGVSVLGGEPLEQWAPLASWLVQIRRLGLGVILFTGMRWSLLRSNARYRRLPALVDTLVDGPFVASQPEAVPGRSVVGSRNQQLWHFSARYRDPKLWLGPVRAQLQVGPSAQVQVHGSPQLVAKIKRRLQSHELSPHSSRP